MFYVFTGIFFVAIFALVLTDEQIDLMIEDDLILTIISLFLYVVYYTILELILSGKTVGKYITKTRAVTNEYSSLDLGSALKRSFCRLVPFDSFSFLGALPIGWHDKWSNTLVIKDKGWVK